MTAAHPRLSIIIVTHNHAGWIEACLRSVKAQRPTGGLEILVVDHESTDATLRRVKASGGVQLMEAPNRGFGAGCNLGAAKAHGEILVFLNPDTVLERGCLQELCRPLSEPRRITTAQILLADRPDHINTMGLDLHFTGLSFVRGLGRPALQGKPGPVPGFSGACFAMRRREFRDLGGFDEDLFLYNEDTEMSWRARSSGFEILGVPGAKVLHHYRPHLTPFKLQHLERSRLILLRRRLGRTRRVLYAPSLATTRLLVWLYASALSSTAREGLRAARREAKAIAKKKTAKKQPRASPARFARRTVPFRTAFSHRGLSGLGFLPNLAYLLNTMFWIRRPRRWLPVKG